MHTNEGSCRLQEEKKKSVKWQQQQKDYKKMQLSAINVQNRK